MIYSKDQKHPTLGQLVEQLTTLLEKHGPDARVTIVDDEGGYLTQTGGLIDFKFTEPYFVSVADGYDSLREQPEQCIFTDKGYITIPYHTTSDTEWVILGRIDRDSYRS